MNRARLLSSTAMLLASRAGWDRRSLVFWETYGELRARGWSDERIRTHAMTNNVRWGEGERERLGAA